jgi:hypothetical protein
MWLREVRKPGSVCGGFLRKINLRGELAGVSGMLPVCTTEGGPPPPYL